MSIFGERHGLPEWVGIADKAPPQYDFTCSLHFYTVLVLVKGKKRGRILKSKPLPFSEQNDPHYGKPQ
jgi:hypothetical protein